MFHKKIKYDDLLIKWLNSKKNYVKESTYANYSNIIYTYIKPFLGELFLGAINHDTIQDYILTLSEKNLSYKTIKDVMVVVKASLKMAFNALSLKPFDLSFNYPKKIDTKLRCVLTKKEQNNLISYVINDVNNKSVGVLICLLTGIRIGEVCALKWKDIDFKKGVIQIDKTIQRIYVKKENVNVSKIIISSAKTLRSTRVIPVNKSFLKLLKTLKSRPDAYVLTSSEKFLEPRTYRYYFSSLLKKINVSPLNFHTLRHTFATNCISLNVDYKTISELLGHSNVTMTLNMYVHPMLSHKKKAMNKLYNTLMK